MNINPLVACHLTKYCILPHIPSTVVLNGVRNNVCITIDWYVCSVCNYVASYYL